MEKILWHRRESRRETEKTNIFLQPREAPAYSNHGEYTLFSANIFVGLRDNHLKGTSHRKEESDLLQVVCQQQLTT